jgi:hypothetical protein
VCACVLARAYTSAVATAVASTYGYARRCCDVLRDTRVLARTYARSQSHVQHVWRVLYVRR